MIEGADPTTNALYGTLLTWGLTALGASLVFVLPKGDYRILMDGSLGFAGGVMIAASYWSLLAPSIEKSAELGYKWEWFPAAVGFAAGGLGIALAEKWLPQESHDLVKALKHKESSPSKALQKARPSLRRRRSKTADRKGSHPTVLRNGGKVDKNSKSYRRVLLLVLAITVHNFPEGLAVGVGFGGVGKPGGMKFSDATTLAWGIGLQNFPEGLAVSLPLYRQGMGKMESFWWGQMSGMVEPIAGVLGALLIQYATPVLPYALSFAEIGRAHADSSHYM